MEKFSIKIKDNCRSMAPWNERDKSLGENFNQRLISYFLKKTSLFDEIGELLRSTLKKGLSISSNDYKY